MKRTLILVLSIALGCMAISATQPTALQKKAKSEIYQALRKVAKSVSDVGDERISFKSDELVYLVHISQEDNGLLYLTILLPGFMLPEEYDSSTANIAALVAAANKPVCSIVVQNELSFSCEMYAKSAEPFIEVLPAMIEALRSSIEGFADAYRAVESGYAPVSYYESMGNKGNSNIFFYPEGQVANDSELYISKVELGRNYTILDMTSYNKGEWDWCRIDRGTYLLSNGKRYKLIKAEGIAYSPGYTYYPNYQSGKNVSVSFKLYFEPLPQGTSTFDFIETNDGWQIEGVTLDNSNIIPINNGQRISTAYHYWECESIQLLKGRTVVYKSCQPKSNGTYMYSTPGEFIEDAETGRRYYLITSNLGTEDNERISHDTNVVEFAEVYPVLPSYVKIINISSGSQYYVKGLRIR